MKTGPSNHSVADSVMAPRISGSSWLGKGSWAILDQGLISSSNFLIGILLARWLLPEQYGAYALAFEIFSLLAVSYQAMILEPMAVFGSSAYGNRPREYMGTLLWAHFGLAFAIMIVLGISSWVAFEPGASSHLGQALGGVAIAAPCVLLLRLARQGFYLRLAPKAAAFGAAVYCSIVLGGLFAVYRWGRLDVFSAFLLMGIASLITSVVLLPRLGPVLGLGLRSLDEISRRHWVYGRWALASSVLISSPWEIQYASLSIFSGMAAIGDLKALLNFYVPVSQTLAAFSLLSLPYASRVYNRGGTAGIRRLTQRLYWTYSGATIAYWIVIVLFRKTIISSFYGGKYVGVADLVPWLALASVLTSLSMVQTTCLRAIQSPASVFIAYCACSAVALILGVPAAWLFGLRGAVFAVVASSATAVVSGFILLRRRTRAASRISSLVANSHPMPAAFEATQPFGPA
jgi:O-antigen/teichoic acid export membrane protein